MSAVAGLRFGLRRAIVKIGSALLVDGATGAVNAAWLAALAQDVAALRARGVAVAIVTSGAIALGRGPLGYGLRALRLEEKQAAAALGQIQLANAYQAAFAPHKLAVAQILLSLGDTEDRRRHLNARATLETLLDRGAIPLINENDTVATAEIRFGDNDRLAARVAQMIGADTLILLSDVDGLYTADPRRDAGARHIACVAEVTPDIAAMAAPAPLGYSSGGMVTKLEAARIALAAGCRMAIAAGRADHPLRALDEGARCTWFLPSAEPLQARKRWIAGAIQPVGALTVDRGAAAALAQGKSLLPAGVTRIAGRFDRGDVVLIATADGAVIGRGLSAYGAADAARIAGRKSGEIEAILGYCGREEIIRRDDLVLDAAPVAGPGREPAPEREPAPAPAAVVG